MGVPKFARFICERYPCILELLNEYQIPEFDNLYLDMNGIIHCCSHPNDADAHFRITEEAIMTNIFRYVDLLFCTIKPQKLFFMAVDGVAPRAKINQQRGRRFRSAKEAELVEARARARGETIPDAPRFDSNCITPGTEFMAKLTEQLKYFVTYKISTNKLWQKCKIILSGPEVPGEGEHKIMDYIRYLKSQPDHDPNTRHCLYGLDADLIILGLCTHEPHFTVLREEVKYSKNVQKCTVPEKIKFCLLHISLLREYMEHEFESLKDKLPFPFDTEKIIDDWILMGFLVGNDFIPHLPNLQIANGALPLLYHAYMEVLPTLDGYINEAGTLNLERFEKFMERLAVIDIEHFTEHLADLKYFEGKTGRRPNENERTSYKKSKESVESPKDTPISASPPLSPKATNKELNALIQLTDEMLLGHSDEEEQFDTDSDSDVYNLEFLLHKRDYYMNKLDYENVDADVMRSQAEGYVTAIQWNLHYYYDGCRSWSWYYPHHYAPYISDIKGFKDLKFDFEMGEPFMPFQQLLAVLPPASKNLLPEAYQALLTEEESPIIDYYPGEFSTDLNEKKQEWEAIVLIPFIDEKRLRDAMQPLESNLTPEEIERNRHGPMYIITYTSQNMGTIKAPKYFPTIESHANITTIGPEEIEVPQENLVKGLVKNTKLHVYYSGFPTMQHIEHTASLEKAKVKVFEHPSRGDNMIIRILPKNIPTMEQLAADILGKIVYVKWPHLMEAHVIGISNGERQFMLINFNLEYSVDNLKRKKVTDNSAAQWMAEARNIAQSYRARFGIDVGDINIIIYARTIIGRRYILTKQGRLSLEKEWCDHPVAFSLQAIIPDLKVEEGGFMVHKNVTDIFVPESVCFMLGHPHYGAMGEVLAPGINVKTGRIKVAMRFSQEPNFEKLKLEQNESRMQYMSGNIAAQRLGISSHLLSRITGSIFVLPGGNEQSDRKQQNIGLNLKFNKKNEELPGYTKKANGQWLYSSKAIGLIRDYMDKFPTLFERLVQNLNTDIYNENDLFSENPQEMSDILKWIKEQPFRSINVRNCDWVGVDPDIIQKISVKVDKYLEHDAGITRTVLMQVKPHLLYKPCLNTGNIAPDPTAHHKIFDRIIAVTDDSCIPIGYKGTIITVMSNSDDDPAECLYEVLFDKPLAANISFASGATTRRFKIHGAEFINISHGLRAEQIMTDICTVLEKNKRKKPSVTPPDNTSHTKSSAFASFNKHDNFFPVFCKTQNDFKQTQPQIQVIKKNMGQKNFPESPIKNDSTQKKFHTHSDLRSPSKQRELPSAGVTTPMSSNKPQSTVPDRATEFQMLWNELHKLPSVPGPPTKSMDYPAMLPRQPPLPSATESPQDPSAFLKAVLRIPDDKSVNNSSQPSTKTPAQSFAFPSTPPVLPSSTPNLVQQLFDHARQASRKDNISYCTLLLNHFQLLGVGMPRYFYSTDEKNLTRAQIILPDMRSYQGEACGNYALAAESAALIVYKELNLDKTTKLPPYYDPLSRDTWGNIPPPNVPLNAQKIMSPGPFPDAQKPTIRPPANWNQPHPRMPSMSSGFTHIPPTYTNRGRSQPPSGENKIEEKKPNVTPFVPLQAQKKTRPRNKPKETLQSSQSDVIGTAPVKHSKIYKQKKSNDYRTSIDEKSLIIATGDKPTTTNEAAGSTKDNPPQGQKTQKTPRQRRSRIAANFSTSTAAEAANGNKKQ